MIGDDTFSDAVTSTSLDGSFDAAAESSRLSSIASANRSSRPPPLVCALKAEWVDAKGRYTQTIRMEVSRPTFSATRFKLGHLQANILRHLQHSGRFCRLYLACQLHDGRTNVMIMSLVGRSLSWLRRQAPRARFTLSTSIRASLQCLEVRGKKILCVSRLVCIWRAHSTDFRQFKRFIAMAICIATSKAQILRSVSAIVRTISSCSILAFHAPS